ncbi:MAG: DUF1905 domain-containing protein [Rhodospirillaceae bacterium]
MRTKVWLWSAEKASWHFVTLPKKVSASIKAMTEGMRSPMGSVRVAVTIKRETWKTSLFPAKQAGAYVLPIKAEVRKKAKIGAGDTVGLTIELEG